METTVLKALIKQIWSDFVTLRNDLDKVIWSEENILKYLIENKEILKNLTKEMVVELENGETLEQDFIREYLYDVLDTEETLDEEDDVEESTERQKILDKRHNNLDNFIDLAINQINA
jgi:hypothetical protein